MPGTSGDAERGLPVDGRSFSPTIRVVTERLLLYHAHWLPRSRSGDHPNKCRLPGALPQATVKSGFQPENSNFWREESVPFEVE